MAIANVKLLTNGLLKGHIVYIVAVQILVLGSLVVGLVCIVGVIGKLIANFSIVVVVFWKKILIKENVKHVFLS